MLDRQDRAGRLANHPFGDAPDHQMDQAAAAVGAHDDHVGVQLLGHAENFEIRHALSLIHI